MSDREVCAAPSSSLEQGGVVCVRGHCGRTVLPVSLRRVGEAGFAGGTPSTAGVPSGLRGQRGSFPGLPPFALRGPPRVLRHRHCPGRGRRDPSSSIFPHSSACSGNGSLQDTLWLELSRLMYTKLSTALCCAAVVLAAVLAALIYINAGVQPIGFASASFLLSVICAICSCVQKHKGGVE